MDRTDQSPEAHDSCDLRDFVSVVATMLDSGQLAPELFDRLERTLRDDDVAMRQYLALLDLDAHLRWAYRGGMQPQAIAVHDLEASGSNPVEIGSEPAGNGAAETESKVVSSRIGDQLPDRARWLPQPIGLALRDGFRRHRVASLAVAGSLAAVATIGLLLAAWSSWGGVGRITQSATAQWAAPHALLTTGMSVDPGKYYLLGGVAEITLAR